MKTLEWVKENINIVEQDDFLDRRFTKRFLDYIPTEEWEQFGFKFTGDDNDKPVVKEWTEENILQQLKEDVSFGIEKATAHRGISASLMYSVVQAWCIVLENGLDTTDYGWYGNKLFEAVDKYYNFGLVDENTFDEDFFEEW